MVLRPGDASRASEVSEPRPASARNLFHSSCTAGHEHDIIPGQDRQMKVETGRTTNLPAYLSFGRAPTDFPAWSMTSNTSSNTFLPASASFGLTFTTTSTLPPFPTNGCNSLAFPSEQTKRMEVGVRRVRVEGNS